MALSFVVGNTAPSIFGALMVNGSPISLVGAAGVRFQMRSEIDNRFSVDGSADIDGDPAAGNVSYSWQPGDLAEAGTYVGRWQVTFGDGSIQSSDPVNDITVAL